MSYPVGMTAEPLTIEVCPPELQADALRLVHNGLSADQQAGLPAALEDVRDQGPAALAGLFVARRGSEVNGATWVQLTPGRTAVLWPPAIDGPVSAQLMQAAEEFISARRIPLAQMLIHPDAPQSPDLLAEGGFVHLVDLEYLALDGSHFPAYIADDQLKFLPFSQIDRQHFADTLMATYAATMDCPQINGLRSADDILESYQSQGIFSPDRWFLIQHEEQDVGVLILTEYPATQNWELIYMGIIPPARGRQFGQRVVCFALGEAAGAGASRLVLAADAANAPALAMYHACGLFTWDHRRVYARLEGRGARS